MLAVLVIRPTNYFNPRSPRGERPAPRYKTFKSIKNFNPRSPRGERLSLSSSHTSLWVFQSTLPAGGATVLHWVCLVVSWNFNPRSPRGERRSCRCMCAPERRISIHAPRGGSDYSWMARQRTAPIHFNPRSPRGERPYHQAHPMQHRFLFQSTLPAGGATNNL